jgi:class 3 adenylate cyclase/tetratricopeptide (TPR) repeat protein
VRCPNCGEENPERARFCIVCGTALTGPPRPAEERKVVTVLFCELTGLPDPGRSDPEDVRARLAPYLLRIRGEIEAKGGTLDKFLAQGMLGVFGAPLAHEDDPERAVRSALAILDSVAELNASADGPGLSPRVGIETGEVVVAFGQGPQIGESVTGDVVNTASRFLTVAHPGWAIVGQTTYAATREVFDYEDLGTVTVKGKREALSVWRPLGARSRLGVGVEARERPAAPFVGRADERALLMMVFGRAVRGSSVQLVTVTGEPGIGKSRLIAEFKGSLEALPDPVRWRQGRCLPYGEGITFWALGEVVKAEAGILESDQADEAAAKLRAAIDALIADASERAWFRTRLSPLIGVGSASSADRAESFAAWRRFIEAIAARSPLVLAIEDLHWADPAMVAFLVHLAASTAPLPVLIVVSARPELYARHPTWGGGKGNTLTVALPPLSREETATLIGSLLDRAALPTAAESTLLEQAGGNPLYAEEFVRMLTDRGLIDGRGRVTAELGSLAFPDSVHALIAARLDALAAEEKSLLQDASVVGKVFWAGALAELGGVPVGDVRNALDGLAGRELVRPSRTSSIAGELEYQFWHGLVRDVAYGQIPRAVRADRHRRAAAWLERVAGERVADHAEVLAYHARRALELSLASGRGAGAGDATWSADMGALRDQARRYLTLAGERAMSLDVTKAEEHLRAALELTGREDAGRADVIRSLAETAFLAGRLEEAQGLYEDAVTALDGADRASDAAAARVGLFRVLQYRGETGPARDLLSDATRVLEREPPGPALTQAIVEAAGALMTSGRFREAIAEADRGIVVARQVGDAEQEIRALGFRGYARVGLGETNGLDEEREALERALALGLGRTTAVAYNNVANDLRMVEGPAAAVATFDAGVAFADARGLDEMAAWMRMTSLLPLIDLGDWDEVLRRGGEVMDDAKRRGAGYDEAFAGAIRAYVLAHRGDPAAAAAVDELLPRAREIGDPQVLEGALTAASLVRLSQDAASDAAALVEQALDATAEAGTDARSWYLPDLVRTAIAAGEVDLGTRLTEGLRGTLPRYRLAIASARSALLEASGEVEHAAGWFGGVAALWEAYGHVPERALALLGLGRCLVALGRPAEALAPLRDARDGFERLQAGPSQAEADRLLARAGAAGD